MCRATLGLIFAATVAGAALAVPEAGLSAETKCPSISARTFHSAKSTASATEASGECKISIDGADASTQSVSSIVRCSFVTPFVQLFGLDRGFDRTEWVAKQIIPLLITPSLPSTGLTSDPGLALSPFDAGTCQQQFDNLAMNGGQPFDSPLHQEVANDLSLLSEITSCLDNPQSPPSDICHVSPDGQLVFEFSTSLGDHVLALPLQ